MSTPLDLDTLRDVAGDCGWTVAELAERFAKQVEEGLAGIEDAIEAGDGRLVERLAHGLVGTSATCGAESLAALFRAIEAAGEEARLDDVSPLLDEARRGAEEIARIVGEAEGQS